MHRYFLLFKQNGFWRGEDRFSQNQLQFSDKMLSQFMTFETSFTESWIFQASMSQRGRCAAAKPFPTQLQKPMPCRECAAGFYAAGCG
jgi:hypothetical protein